MRRLIPVGLLFILLLLFVAGCTNEPTELAVSPTIPATAPSLQPTPTLASGAPTPPLPTPPVTPPAGANNPQEKPAYFPEDDPAQPTPEIIERLNLGADAFDYGNYPVAIFQLSKALQQEPALDEEGQAEILYQLGIAYLAEGEMDEAATMFNQLLGLEREDTPAAANFHLAQASFALGDFDTAVEQYNAYLDVHPDMAAYIYPLIAETYLAMGDSQAAYEAYESALTGYSHRLKEYNTRLILANYHLEKGNYEAAIEQYDAINSFAQTENTRGQITYLAGAAELQAGNTDAAYKRFLSGVADYPGVYESYLGLVELVKAEIAVDDYQRGLVDYYAAAYAPGLSAFEAYINANPEDYRPDAHLYLAWSHEALGDHESALSELDRYAAYEPALALYEQAELLVRVGEIEKALTSYQDFLGNFPDSDKAPLAAWEIATLLEQTGEIGQAIDQFQSFADKYPEHENVPEALYHAGWLAETENDTEIAYGLWQQAAEEYTGSVFGSAAIIRLLRDEQEMSADRLTDLRELAVNNTSTHYQALRARDIAMQTKPFDGSLPFTIPTALTADQADSESWLLDQLEETPDNIDDELGDLNQALLEDERLIIGEKLWELRLFEEAKRELEDLREVKADSIIDSYQLALFFRELGLYRSSILAADAVINLTNQSVLAVPSFIGQLAYPVYFADHILPLAEEYGYDPRLQFSLVRQESLFESFARSGAAAQGLSQVIPDTGAWIAEQLQWPGYDNDDLYKPHVGLEFGAYYLAQQLDTFDGDVHAALAAYNAGPGNAARWYETSGSDIDQYIDVVDFWETRTYIERIYAGFDIYRRLYEP